MIFITPIIQTQVILIQQIFIEHLQYARFCSMHIRDIGEETEILIVYILSGADKQILHILKLHITEYSRGGVCHEINQR